MKVDFNNLRKKACFAYDRLAKKLNKAIGADGEIIIDPEDIQEEMDDLRQLIASIASCYFEGSDEVKDVYEEAYAGDESMVDFNPEPF